MAPDSRIDGAILGPAVPMPASNQNDVIDQLRCISFAAEDSQKPGNAFYQNVMAVKVPRKRISALCIAVTYSCWLIGCGPHGGPSKAEQAYFENYSNETRKSITWWKQQVDTTQLIRLARSAPGPAESSIAADVAAKRDEALQTLRHEYELTPEEVQAVVNGQVSRKIEEQLARARRKLEVRIDRLEKIFSETRKEFEKNPTATVDELKRAENNLENYLKDR
jgi:hypothetical protein